MSRSTLFDRLNQELEAFGRKAQWAIDDGKLQIELLRVRRKQDHVARDLGLLVHRRERGGEADPRRIDGLLLRLDDLAGEIARLEGQVQEAKRELVLVGVDITRLRASSPDQMTSSAMSSSEKPSGRRQDRHSEFSNARC